jgi:hypothetical protein
LQQFADSLGGLEPASRSRCLSSIKSLLAFGHRIGYLRFDAGRMLKVPVWPFRAITAKLHILSVIVNFSIPVDRL